MCGIVGYVGNKQALTVVVDGLRRLEYRGYDSAGVLYQSLDYQNLNAAAKKRAEKSIVIISALFGALKLTDSIPTYKLDMTKLQSQILTENLQ